MPKIIVLITVLAALALPATASARHHRHHHHHHARSAWVVTSGCEYPGEPSWTEWRQGMMEAGFTQAETEEIEVCAD